MIGRCRPADRQEGPHWPKITPDRHHERLRDRVGPRQLVEEAPEVVGTVGAAVARSTTSHVSWARSFSRRRTYADNVHYVN